MKLVSLNIAGALALCIAAPLAAAPETSQSTAAAKPAPATAADVKAGAPLRDVDGAPVGTIVSGTDQAVVVDTGQTKIGVPLNIFQKDDKGLLLKITAKQFSDAVAKAHARAQAQAQQQPAQPQQQAPAQPPK
jgi:hypothetical protein